MSVSFRFLKAEAPELLRETYRLRYQVYCQELNFLNPENYPEGLETDEYDPHSIHFAAFDQEGEMVGTIRLIKGANITFPIEVHCRLNIKINPVRNSSGALYPARRVESPTGIILKSNPAGEQGGIISNGVNGNGLLRESLAEISRLAVSKKYRKRVDDGRTGMESYPIAKDSEEARRELESREYRRKRPEIVLGLYKLMYHESKQHHLTHWFAAMERTLWEVLNRYGMQFKQIGEEVDYYGPVIPYLGSISDLERYLHQMNPELYASYFLTGLDPQYWPEFIKANPIHH